MSLHARRTSPLNALSLLGRGVDRLPSPHPHRREAAAPQLVRFLAPPQGNTFVSQHWAELPPQVVPSASRCTTVSVQDHGTTIRRIVTSP